MKLLQCDRLYVNAYAKLQAEQDKHVIQFIEDVANKERTNTIETNYSSSSTSVIVGPSFMIGSFFCPAVAATVGEVFNL